jgi:hypothetical protein
MEVGSSGYAKRCRLGSTPEGHQDWSVALCTSEQVPTIRALSVCVDHFRKYHETNLRRLVRSGPSPQDGSVSDETERSIRDVYGLGS